MNGRRFLAILTLGVIPLSLVAEPEAKPPQPLVLLYVRDPWRMVIGSDSPRFALYDNGLVIYASGEKEAEKAFLSRLLPMPELKELLASLDLERRLGGLDGKTIDASEKTDQPTTLICYWVNGQRKAISVYGALRSGAPERERVPKPFLEVFDALTGFHAQGAKPWLPPLIEVLIWPFENSKLTPEPWPKEWPGLDDPLTKKREMIYSLFLESKHFSDFLALGRKMRSGQAVLIGGKKWAVSYRIPFPGGF